MDERDMNSWNPVLPPMQLDGDEVHVWKAPLGGPSGMQRFLEDTLSRDERERADRFHFDCHRDRYVRARGLLRWLLAEYLSVDPTALTFTYSSYGKPSLGGVHASQMAFNVSHSEDLALFAFSRRGEIGVDVEAIRSLPDRDSLAQQLFSDREVESLGRLRADLKDDAFFTCWTRKEAYVKALGEGLSRPLDTFEVTFTESDPPALRVIDDAAESARWSMYGLIPGAGFAGALVTEGTRRVSCWQWCDTPLARPIGSHVGLDLT
jgi:4'-phosphopantetheinyl transferase